MPRRPAGSWPSCSGKSTLAHAARLLHARCTSELRSGTQTAGLCVGGYEMGRRVSFVLGISGLVVLAPLGSATRSPAAITALAPARFAPAAGWQVRVGKVHACVGVPASRC